MGKAEEKALEVYPKDIEEYVDINGMKSVVDNNSWQRTIFLKGYHQAEKDLALTIEDIEKIDNLLWNLSSEWSGKNDNAGYFQEVLNQFNKYKEE